jgi:hypothetical protein
MVVKQMESYVGRFVVVVILIPSLPPPPTHTLQNLKNNQNQMNTTGAQNLKEFNDTAEIFVMI